MPEQPFDYQLLADRFKEIRQSKNLTQKQIAEILGVTERTIVRIETAKSGLGDKTISSIIKHLGIDVFQYLIDYENQLKARMGDYYDPKYLGRTDNPNPN